MSDSNQNTNRLGELPVGKLLLEFSVPAITAMIANALYNVVDSIFVGRGVGSLALTAVTIAFPIMIILMAFSMLIGIGSTALISIRLGQQNREEAEKILGTAFALSIVTGIALSAVILIFLDPILIFLGATPDVFDYAKQFSTVIVIGAVFQFLSFGMNNTIRADGNPVISMATMLFSAGLNTLLNPLFIFGFHWGVVGSAMATVTTMTLVSGYVFYYFTKGPSNLKLRRKNFRIRPDMVAKIASIGLSPFLLQMAASVVTFAFNSSLLVYGGEMAVAAMGVINRSVMMLLMPIFGINQGAQPIIGYNYGAGKYDRVKKTLKLAVIAATMICVFGFLVAQVFSRQIIGLFNKDSELIEIGAHGIRIFLAVLPIVGMQIVITNYFQSVGKASRSILLSLTRQVLFLIPLILILPSFLNLNGIWLATPIADFSSTLVAAILIMKELRYLQEKHDQNGNSLIQDNNVITAGLDHRIDNKEESPRDPR
ncbi:MAG TPA: MATE family efflux transporter [Anaerovoracaceae bacterium]|nr:MATE family efflux transporter [Anaerovoracaceae bacterium]